VDIAAPHDDPPVLLAGLMPLGLAQASCEPSAVLNAADSAAGDEACRGCAG
jgi:hypothetical protein